MSARARATSALGSSIAGHHPTLSAGSQPSVLNSGFGAVREHPGMQKRAR
jgi:hypothetical protein